MFTPTDPKARLLSDVYSTFKKGLLYGSRLDIVTIIADHDSVLIVESKKKERFPVNKSIVQIL